MSAPVVETVAKGLQRYVLPVKNKLAEKSIRRQMLEINGVVDFDKGKYHNQNYENHIRKLVESRTAFRQTKDIGQRKKIATEELQSWKNYVETRRGDLPQEFEFTDKMKENFKQSWDIIKNRHENTLQPSKILKVHEEYVKLFKFEIPIDAKNLARLVHPHYAYLASYPGQLHFDDVMNIYSNKVVSGFEDYSGQELLASEIAAYTYWTSIDKDLKGYMSLKDFGEFMKIFRMAVPNREKEFKDEFKFALGFMQNEFDRDISEADAIVRFDFMRHIFLERNL
jgi:hypothetical protein